MSVSTLIKTLDPLRLDRTGTYRVKQTRVTLDTVWAAAHEMGHTPEEIAGMFPSVSSADVREVLEWCASNPDETARYIERRAEQSGSVMARVAESFPTEGLRERLLERKTRANPVSPCTE
jgi:uncharacterized protein (DUF433 family)